MSYFSCVYNNQQTLTYSPTSYKTRVLWKFVLIFMYVTNTTLKTHMSDYYDTWLTLACLLSRIFEVTLRVCRGDIQRWLQDIKAIVQWMNLWMLACVVVTSWIQPLGLARFKTLASSYYPPSSTHHNDSQFATSGGLKLLHESKWSWPHTRFVLIGFGSSSRFFLYLHVCECIAMMMNEICIALQPNPISTLPWHRNNLEGGAKTNLKRENSRPGLIIGVQGSDERGGAHQ